MEAVVMKINGRWWYFPGDAINTILWELTFRQGVPYLHECTGNMVRGIEVESVEIGRPKPLIATHAIKDDGESPAPGQKVDETAGSDKPAASAK